jgi:hypothetical protein
MSNHGATLGPIDEIAYWVEVTDADYGGADHTDSNVDTADTTLLAGHGSASWSPAGCEDTDSCTPVRWKFWLSRDDASPNGCFARTNYMAVGENQLEYYDHLSCESAEPLLTDHLVAHTYRLHQWKGFTGISNTMMNVYLNDYVEDAFDGPAAYAWIENLTLYDAWGQGTKDICATVLTRGNDGPDAGNRRAYENYGDPIWYYTDPTGGGWAWSYYCNCDPNHVNGGPIGCG